MWGCCMQDALPQNEKTANKYWLTIDKEGQRGLLYEYDNKTALIKNINPVIHRLLYNFTGNSHIVYNSSMFYYNNQMKKLIKYDLITKECSFLDFYFINDQKLLYQSSRNYVDLIADENGLWTVFSNADNNNTMVLKFNVNQMANDHTSKIEQVWNLNLDHQSTGKILIICGVVYPIKSLFELTTTIETAFDLYTNQRLDIDLEAIKFTNPFKHNSMLNYNPKNQRILGWDKTSIIEYPIILGSTD